MMEIGVYKVVCSPVRKGLSFNTLVSYSHSLHAAVDALLSHPWFVASRLYLPRHIQPRRLYSLHSLHKTSALNDPALQRLAGTDDPLGYRCPDTAPTAPPRPRARPHMRLQLLKQPPQSTTAHPPRGQVPLTPTSWPSAYRVSIGSPLPHATSHPRRPTRAESGMNASWNAAPERIGTA